MKAKTFDGQYGTGWEESPLDLRDYSNRHPKVVAVSEANKPKASIEDKRFSLRELFPTPRDQRNLGSCCAFAGVGVMEYLAHRVYGVDVDLSERYLYKLLRHLLGWEGDTGGYLRATAAAMRAAGVCHEREWPYDVPNFDDVPPWSVAVSAAMQRIPSNRDKLTYFRHDAGTNTPPECVAISIREWLAKGIPTMYGFTIFSDMAQSDVRQTGNVPLPNANAYSVGGHANIIVGWDDKREITNPIDGHTTVGAFESRNSWGSGYGDDGYLWIPYGYFNRKYARDAWSIISMDMVDLEDFGL